jgi:hypothetical protein
MDQSDSAGNTPIQLERNKQIDAICDRFELAWDAGSPPRIEEYLELLPAADRRRLLAELLASELALRGPHDGSCNRAAYTERFPQYRDIIAEVFRRQPEPAREAAAAGEIYFEIIQAVRSRLRPDALTKAIYDRDQDWRALADQFSRYAQKTPAHADETLEQQLWPWIIHTCGKLTSLDPSGVEAVVRGLLESFPPARRSILIDLLLGQTISQAAQANGVTQRTVTSTVLVATKLLEQAD